MNTDFSLNTQRSTINYFQIWPGRNPCGSGGMCEDGNDQAVDSGSRYGNYLNISGLEVALLLNFKEATLTWKRVVRESKKSS